MASDIDIYKTQNFGNRLGFGEKAALLIVDFVNGFTDPAKFGAAISRRRSTRPWASSPSAGGAACRSRTPA